MLARSRRSTVRVGLLVVATLFATVGLGVGLTALGVSAPAGSAPALSEPAVSLVAASGLSEFVPGVAGAGPNEPDAFLVVTDADGTEIVAVPVDSETEITVEYTHSVERTLVRDVYVPSENGITMVRMEFSSFGAGLPSEANVTETDGRYVYEPLRTEYETLRLQTGPIADHDLVVDGDRYDIASLSGYGAVEITVDYRQETRP